MSTHFPNAPQETPLPVVATAALLIHPYLCRLSLLSHQGTAFILPTASGGLARDRRTDELVALLTVRTRE